MIKVLKNKFVRFHVLADSIQMLGANIYNMVFVVYLATIYDSKLLVGLADSLVYLPALLSIWLGFRADKTRQKAKWLINFALIQGLVFLAVAHLVGFKAYGVVILVAVLNVFSDTISSYLNYLMQPIFKNKVPDEELEATYSFFQVVSLVAVLASQPIGIWLLSITDNNFSLIALVNALAFFLSALIYWVNKDQLTHKVVFPEVTETAGSQLKKMYETTKNLFQQSGGLGFLQMIVLLLLGNVLSTSFLTLMNIQLLDVPVWQLSYAKSLSLLLWSQILGGLIGGLTINYLFKNLNLLTILVLQSLLMVLISLSGVFKLDSEVFLLLSVALTFLGARFGPIFNTMLMRYVPDEQLGQVSAFSSFLVTLAIPLGSVGFSLLGAYNLTLAWLVFLVLSVVPIVMLIKSNLTALKG